MWESLTATGFAGALLAMVVTPSVADEQFIPYQADGNFYIKIPNTGAATLAAPPV
jgi:hypothetical protein